MCERRANRVVNLALGTRRATDGSQHGRVLSEVHGDAVEPGADPDELARGAELVELLGAIVGDASGQQLGLPERDGQRERLQRHESLPQARAPVDAVPRGEEPRERRLLGGLHLLAERRQRRPAQPPQHLGVAPLALGAARAQLAADEQLLGLQRAQHVLDVDSEAGSRLGRRERPVPPRPAVDELAQRRLRDRSSRGTRRAGPTEA